MVGEVRGGGGGRGWGGVMGVGVGDPHGAYKLDFLLWFRKHGSITYMISYKEMACQNVTVFYGSFFSICNGKFEFVLSL